MRHDDLKLPPRTPRHGTAADGGHPVRIQRTASEPPVLVDAALINFSRSGYQVRTATPLVPGDAVVLRLTAPESGFQTALPGVVRWQQPETGPCWLVGCQCEDEVAWETLGELFLHGILAADAP